MLSIIQSILADNCFHLTGLFTTRVKLAFAAVACSVARAVCIRAPNQVTAAARILLVQY